MALRVAIAWLSALDNTLSCCSQHAPDNNEQQEGSDDIVVTGAASGKVGTRLNVTDPVLDFFCIRAKPEKAA